MNLLMTADAVGGVWTYAVDLAHALCARGASVSIAVMGPAPSESQRCQALSVPGVRLFEHEYRLEWMPGSRADVIESGRWLRALAEWLQPDIVHLNGYAHGAVDFQVPTIVVAHSCVLSWWRAVRRDSCPPEWDDYARAVVDGLAGADAIVAPTRSMAAALADCYDYRGSVRVIHNGRNTRALAPAQKQPFIFTAGRLWDDAKNISALSQVASRTPWPIYVAGESFKAGGQPPDQHCNYLGRLSLGDVASWMSRASVYAAPARYEPFGLSVLEAAWSRCALVLSDIPTFRELWDGVAWFVDPDDGDALAEALRDVAGNERLRNWRAHRALALARTYSLDRMVGGYLALYHELLNRRAATGGTACAS
jgi:glycosyltransferase involved in cell wall biosynthesis